MRQNVPEGVQKLCCLCKNYALCVWKMEGDTSIHTRVRFGLNVFRSCVTRLLQTRYTGSCAQSTVVSYCNINWLRLCLQFCDRSHILPCVRVRFWPFRNIIFRNCTAIGTQFGCHIKFKDLQSGSVNGIVFENIAIYDATAYAIGNKAIAQWASATWVEDFAYRHLGWMIVVVLRLLLAKSVTHIVWIIKLKIFWKSIFRTLNP